MHTVRKGWIKLQNLFSSQASSAKFWRRAVILAVIILSLATWTLSLTVQGKGLAPAQTVQQGTVQVTPQPSPTPTPGAEINSNREQTTGVIVGAIFLVLIIVAGTLLSERSLKEH